MMNIKSLLSTKAPVIAIPVEGHAPACIDGKRLRTWAKGVTVQLVRIEQAPAVWYPQALPVPYLHEGPEDLVAIQEHAPRFLVIEGTVASKGFRYSSAKIIRTGAKFTTIARAAAIKTLGDWSSKERKRLAKARVSATITPAQRKALKLSQAEAEWINIPVEIAQFPLLSFAVVRKDEGAFSVIELLTGENCGFGTSVERAILAARQKAATLSPEKIGFITAKCLAPEPVTQGAAA
jgi:hypothetical protein